MDGVILTPLKKIQNPKGDIYKIIKRTDKEFVDFGEAYFSSVNYNEIKGWKKHKKMILNLVVPVGEIEFVIYNGKDFISIKLSQDNYQRLTICPNLWLSFKGIGKNLNLLLNIASIEHDTNESETIEIEKIDYIWK